MKEYITNIIYEDTPNHVIIGTNGTSIIIGENNHWVLLDKQEVKKINAHLSGIPLPEWNLTKVVASKNELLISQGEDTVTLNRVIFGNLSCGNKI